MKLYSIYDTKAKVYYTPMQSNTDEEAIRTIRTVVNDPSTTLHQDPSDYMLMYLGEFDTQTGIIQGCSPRNVESCSNLVINTIPTEE